jgi:MFS family permease
VLATFRSVASLLASYGLLLLANGLFGTLLGVRQGIEGFSTVAIGFVMSSYFAGLLIGALLAVRVVASVGHIRAFAAFASIMSASALVHVLWVDLVVWAMVRLVAGFCMAGMIMVTESWLNERATNETRGRVLSLYMITNYFAAGCGQLLLPLGDPARFQLFAVASIIYSLAVVPVLLTRATAPQPSRPEMISIRQLYRVSPLGLVGAFSAGLANATFYALGPVFGVGIGLPLSHISAFMAVTIFAGLALQWPLGRMSDRLDRRRVLSAVAVATSLSCLLIVATAGRSEPALFVAGMLYGAFAFTLYSLAAAHTNDLAPPDRMVQTASGLLVVYGVGAVLGPVFAGYIMNWIGPHGMFLYSAVVTVGLAIFAVHRMRTGTPVTPDSKTPFTAVPSTQYSSKQLYNAARDHRDRAIAGLAGGRRQR